jgi:hypothetical protein
MAQDKNETVWEQFAAFGATYRSVPNAVPFDQPAFIAAITKAMSPVGSAATNLNTKFAVNAPTVAMEQLVFFIYKASTLGLGLGPVCSGGVRAWGHDVTCFQFAQHGRFSWP